MLGPGLLDFGPDSYLMGAYYAAQSGREEI